MILAYLLGFPTPVIEFFIISVLVFLAGSLYLATQLEDVPGVEPGQLTRSDRDQASTVVRED